MNRNTLYNMYNYYDVYAVASIHSSKRIGQINTSKSVIHK